MTRVKDPYSSVHFVGANGCTMCGVLTTEPDLTGHPLELMRETCEAVTCPDCARLYCQVKNAPCNEVDGPTLERATYDAVK